MPTYEFRCKTCGNRFDVTRSFTEEGTPACTSCGEADAVVKVFPKVGIAFKGSGFYKTDSRSSGSSRSGGGSSDKSSSDKSSSDASSSTSSSASSSSSSSDSSSGSSSPSPSGPSSETKAAAS
jgi:putative FmdB family regulatory protein